ncbi:hypothetical protein [Sulfitobacter sp. PS-8MA]|uniref:hypothetical protein n=1 Tax=Sulfitobacter sp. PS-8MA TaxID=3237707 RepID=UPI0034C5F3B1
MKALLWWLCEIVSRHTCRLLIGYNMPLCAYAWWRRHDSRFWRVWVVVFDLIRRDEPDHGRKSYGRYTPFK